MMAGERPRYEGGLDMAAVSGGARVSVWVMLRGAAAGAWSRARRVERICCVVGALLIAAGLFHLLVFAVDGGPWYGPVSWRKPATFRPSFGLTLIAIHWRSPSL